jgi:acyl-CoA synthetase (AMP-forming)/AMP-acid ligase II
MLSAIANLATANAQALAAVARSGLLSPERPDKLARIGAEVVRRGPIGGACAAAAIRWGDAPALTDERGTLSFADLDRRSNAIARAWADHGIRAGDGIAILCRNHRGFLDATFAAGKLGLRAVLLNTEFAGPQIEDVCRRERLGTLVFDAEYGDRVPASIEHRFLAWTDGAQAGAAPASLDRLIAATSEQPLPAPEIQPAIVMLTSGTTGTPKGAVRGAGGNLVTLGALFERIPLRAREVTWVAPPFFHALGFAGLALSLSLGSRIHTRRRFDAAEFVAGLAANAVTTAVVVPAMLQRTLELGEDDLRGHDTSALRVILCSGAQLPGPTATKTLELFGEVLYVLYGSTEVAFATVSTPADHRVAPASVGKPTLGTRVLLLDERGAEVAPGETGRIFVSNGLEFAGYTDGGTKEVIDGAMSSGDLGHFDTDGRLFIDGRDDEMIVSGGENVFPQEVEEVLMGRDDVAEVAAIGVADPDFGQRLAAYVVPTAGTAPTAEQIQAHVKRHLARYKVPRDVHFIDRLPRNAAGKIVKRSLGAAGEEEAGAQGR